MSRLRRPTSASTSTTLRAAQRQRRAEIRGRRRLADAAFAGRDDDRAPALGRSAPRRLRAAFVLAASWCMMHAYPAFRASIRRPKKPWFSKLVNGTISPSRRRAILS